MDDLGRNHWTNWTGIGGLFAPESVDGFNRNGWTICPGIGGRIGPEYATSSGGLGPLQWPSSSAETGIVTLQLGGADVFLDCLGGQTERHWNKGLEG